MKYFLIHGYGKSLDIREDSIPDNLGFYIFDNEIRNQEAYVFKWAITDHRNFFSKINLFSQVNLYHKERDRISDLFWQQRLFDQMNLNKPEIIICHSMGCKFFINTIQKYKLIPSIKKVVFVLADISQEDNLNILLKKEIDFINIYCFWDNALISSMIINLYKPIGLFGIKKNDDNNLFWKLNYGVNLHQDIWRDDNFKIRLDELIKNC